MSQSQETELVLQDHIHPEKSFYTCPVATTVCALTLTEGTQGTFLMIGKDRNLTPKPVITTCKGRS